MEPYRYPTFALSATDPSTGAVRSPDQPPVVLKRVEPEYPHAAAAQHVAGIVILDAVVDIHGKVRGVRVRKALPFGMTRAAIDAVEQWQFRPAFLNGKPVTGIYIATVSFPPH